MSVIACCCIDKPVQSVLAVVEATRILFPAPTCSAVLEFISLLLEAERDTAYDVLEESCTAWNTAAIGNSALQQSIQHQRHDLYAELLSELVSLRRDKHFDSRSTYVECRYTRLTPLSLCRKPDRTKGLRPAHGMYLSAETLLRRLSQAPSLPSHSP